MAHSDMQAAACGNKLDNKRSISLCVFCVLRVEKTVSIICSYGALSPKDFTVCLVSTDKTLGKTELSCNRPFGYCIITHASILVPMTAAAAVAAACTQ